MVKCPIRCLRPLEGVPLSFLLKSPDNGVGKVGNSGQQKWAISGAIVTPQGVDTSVPDPFGWKFELLLDGKQNTHRDYIFDVRMMIVMT